MSQDKDKSTDSTQNHEDPLFLHPSDTPNLDLVSDLLRGTDNYKVWSRRMITALEAKNKIGFIDGTIKAPEDDPQRLALWRRCNALVKTWIHRSLSHDLVNAVVYCDTACQVWNELEERYNRMNGARLYSLYTKINTLTHGTSSITDYYNKLKDYWDEFEFMVPSPAKEVSQEYKDFHSHLKMMQLLMGVNECYNTVKSQILMMYPLPSHNHAFNILLNEETQKNMSTSSSTSSLNDSSNPTALYGNFQTKEPIVCQHCGYNGHTTEKCFKIHGYPPNWNRGGRRGGRRGASGGTSTPSNRGARANRVISSQDFDQNYNGDTKTTDTSIGLSPQQYQQILKLLNASGATTNDTGTNIVSTYANNAGTISGDLDWQDQGDW